MMPRADSAAVGHRAEHRSARHELEAVHDVEGRQEQDDRENRRNARSRCMALAQNLQRKHRLLLGTMTVFEGDRRTGGDRQVEHRHEAEPEIQLRADIDGNPTEVRVIEIRGQAGNEDRRPRPRGVEPGGPDAPEPPRRQVPLDRPSQEIAAGYFVQLEPGKL